MGYRGREGPQKLQHQSDSILDHSEQDLPPDASSLMENIDLKLDKIHGTIVDSRQDLHTRVVAVEIEMGLLHEDQQKLADRLTRTKHEIPELRPTMQILVGQVCSLTIKVQKLEARAEDSAGRLCRNNFHIVGFSEGVEGDGPVKFFET
ncbi:hypothetical protein NDU88_004968 [Pleurodeles waltl]|uniref:Uncharacterized protein n=1 Tax=Pleurodeles waltl TaxID=8319 RepID=A0AAV7TSR8_PLEWA|nr:hypothetical protein NDU88_004968 [Pleurodeles waltl]